MPAPWTCPRCARRFRNEGQSHSCDVVSVEAFFARHEAFLPAFRRLMEKLARLGDVHAEALPTTIHIGLRGESRFCGIQLRQDHLRVSFLLARVLPDAARIVHREPYGRTRVGFSVAVRTPRDVDAELVGWLTEACALKG